MKATLISWTQDPVDTVLTVWDASKNTEPLDDIRARRGIGEGDWELFQRILEQEIPVAQFISFQFVLEDVPISWREQAVRHRVGVKFGDNYAVDVVPEADISFWSQSMRIQSMEAFADDGGYHIPESIAGNAEAAKRYDLTMRSIQQAYKALVAEGIPMEDARSLIPLGATHRIAMSVNLQALKHIIGERGCWILQGSLWAPIIQSMVDELCAKVHPIFRRLVAPPCVKNDQFTGCVYKEENNRRVDGRDALPPCPLWADFSAVQYRAAIEARLPQYEALWGHALTADWKWK